MGQRLARFPLRNQYGENILTSGPKVFKVEDVGGKVIITFTSIGKGLKTSDGQPLRTFSFDGKSEVEAYLEQNQIVIPYSTQPKFVFYGWSPFSLGNLVNSESLPASTFKVKVE